MSHHYSGPDFGFPHGDARLDLTDLYAFPKPGEADKSILIMNVHPSAAVNPPGSTTRVPFASEALYELKIDTNGDAVADIAYRVRFSSSADGPQTATVRRVEGAQAAETGDSGHVIIEAAPVSAGRDARVTEAGRYRFFAGWRSDPFFFDTLGALNDLQFTGDDFFIDKDVCSIVLELPNAALGSNQVGLWARTLDGASGVWVQADRGALPQQAVFLVGSERDGYHASDPARPASFPSNGRTLTDDAADAFLAILTNGKVSGDKVGPHADLLAEFPYLGPPHDTSVPSHATSTIATELRQASRRLGSS